MKPLPVVALRIGAPCGENFEAMRAGRASRYCAACRRHVVDLSALTRREAEKALKTAHCVSAAYDQDGYVVFRAERRRAPGVGVLAVAASLSVACADPSPELGGEPSAIVAPEREPITPAPAAAPSAESCGAPAPQEEGAAAPTPAKKPRPPKRYPRTMGIVLDAD